VLHLDRYDARIAVEMQHSTLRGPGVDRAVPESTGRTPILGNTMCITSQ